MNPKTTLIMGVAFVAVFVTLAILKLVDTPTDKELAERRDKVVPALHDVEVDNLSGVTVTRGDEQLAFDYVEAADRWQMTKPLDVLAQTSAVRDVFFDLKNLARRDTAAKKDERAGVFTPKDSAGLVEYGLDSPATSITVQYKPKGREATESVTLLVGAPTADKDGLYVKLADENVVFVVNKSNLRILDKKASDFRQQKLVTVSRFDSDLLRLQWPDRQMTAEKKDAKWQLVEPVQDRADANKVEEIIGKLGDLKADSDADYIDHDVTDLAKYGLESPRLVAEIRKPGSTPKPDEKKKSKEKQKPEIVEKVLIGSPVEGKEGKVYAKLADQDYVIAVSADIVKELEKQPNELRSHDLVEVTQSDVDYVRVQSPGAGSDVVLAKKDFDWEIVQPKQVKAEQAAVTELVRKIDDLEIKEFIDQGDRAEFGLDQPRFTVSIWHKGLASDDKSTADSKEKKAEKKPDAGGAEPKGEPVQVHVGKVDDEKKVAYVRRGNDATIFAVSADGLLDTIERDYLAYRRKQVLSFVQTDVSKLVIRRNDKVFSAERKKQKEEDIQESWRLTEPVDAPADGNTISRVLNNFARLNAKKFFAESASDLQGFGLDQPIVRATATLKPVGEKEPEQHVLLVGTESPDGGYYAKLGSEDLVFSLDRTLVDDLNSELHDRTIVRFDSTKAQSIHLTWPEGKKLELVNKKAEGQAASTWSVAHDESFALDSRKVIDFVSQLSLLTADRFVQYQGDYSESQGLLQPALTVEVKLDGDATHTVRFGAVEGDKRHVAAGDKSGPVALIAEDRFKEAIAGPDHFAQPPQKTEGAKPDLEKSEAAPPESKDPGKDGGDAAKPATDPAKPDSSKVEQKSDDQSPKKAEDPEVKDDEEPKEPRDGQ